MGIGGGFIMIPAMIYLIGMPTSIVIGTSLMQVIFVTIYVTFMQAIITHTVDIILASSLIITSVIGAQYGTRIGVKVPEELLRATLAVIMLILVLRLIFQLVITPTELFTINRM